MRSDTSFLCVCFIGLSNLAFLSGFLHAARAPCRSFGTLRFLLGPRIYDPPFAKTRLRLRQFARWRKLAQTSLRKPRYRHPNWLLPCAAEIVCRHFFDHKTVCLLNRCNVYPERWTQTTICRPITCIANCSITFHSCQTSITLARRP